MRTRTHSLGSLFSTVEIFHCNNVNNVGAPLCTMYYVHCTPYTNDKLYTLFMYNLIILYFIGTLNFIYSEQRGDSFFLAFSSIATLFVYVQC